MKNYSLTESTKILLKYFNNNTNDNKDIIRYNTHKLRHSNWVLEVWRLLLLKVEDRINIDSELKKQIEISLLMHDIWRFLQNNKERILTNEEFEHWDVWYEILKEHDFNDTICLAVKYHNKYSIEEIYQEITFQKMDNKKQDNTIFITNFLRDADKLQNMLYLIFSMDWITRLNPQLEDWNISENALIAIKSKQLVNKKDIKTKADEVLSFLCWSFDINFNESFKLLEFYNYNSKIFWLLKSIPEIDNNSIKDIKSILYI